MSKTLSRQSTKTKVNPDRGLTSRTGIPACQPSVARKLASITEDLRRNYLWNPHDAASALRLHPNKFGTWWYATRGKLIELFVEMPGETAAELASLIAEAEMERQRRQSEQPKPIRLDPRR